MSGDMMAKPEQHRIKKIEELACKLGNTVGNTLTKVNAINKFFFGAPDDVAKAPSGTAELTGWLDEHIAVLRRLNDRAQDIYDALGNLYEVIDKK